MTASQKGFHFLLCIIASIASMARADPKAIQTGTGHEFACADYSGNKIFIVAPDGKVTWEYPAKTCDDIWVLPNGNILFNTGDGVTEVTRDKKVVFRYDSKSEVYACQRLPNGDTFIGECNAGRLLEVDPAGSIVHEVRILPEGQDGGHAFMRNARKLPNGNYLVAFCGGEIVREYDPAGNIVLEIPAPSGPHSAIRLPNGNTLIACGDLKKEPSVFEADKTGKIVWKLTKDELPGISLKFMTGLHRLPNGNTVITNWVGHGEFGKAPAIIEITPDKKVLWTFQDDNTMKTVSSIQILDVPGDPLKWEVLH